MKEVMDAVGMVAGAYLMSGVIFAMATYPVEARNVDHDIAVRAIFWPVFLVKMAIEIWRS